MILDCGLIELVQNVVTMRSVILNCYEAIGIKVSKSTLQGCICSEHNVYTFLIKILCYYNSYFLFRYQRFFREKKINFSK